MCGAELGREQIKQVKWLCLGIYRLYEIHGIAWQCLDEETNARVWKILNYYEQNIGF